MVLIPADCMKIQVGDVAGANGETGDASRMHLLTLRREHNAKVEGGLARRRSEMADKMGWAWTDRSEKEIEDRRKSDTEGFRIIKEAPKSKPKASKKG